MGARKQPTMAEKITGEAEDVYGKIIAGKKPSMKFPLRSLSNVRYRSEVGYFELKGRKKERTLTVSTVKTFAQTLRMLSLSKDLVDGDDIATKREAYYVSKNWGPARFEDQPESDTVIDDIEAHFCRQPRAARFHPRRKRRRGGRQAHRGRPRS